MSDIHNKTTLKDHMKTDCRAADELVFDDSYFRQEKPAVDICDDAEEESLPDSAASSPWERMADWIHCFCVVTFDLEICQMIEVMSTYKFLIYYLTLK